VTASRSNTWCVSTSAADGNILPGWINIDRTPLPGVDIVTDLEDCTRQRLPLEDGSADEFFLSHLIEHIRQPLPLMEELHRIAKHPMRS